MADTAKKGDDSGSSTSGGGSGSSGGAGYGGCCCPKSTAFSACPSNRVIFCTSSVYVMYFFMGVSMPLMGTTVVHLERLFDVDTASMSFTFTAISLGVMIGSFICGIVYDRMPAVFRELAFSVAILLLGTFMASAPFLGELGGLAAFIPMATAWTIPRGFYATCSQPYCVNMWEGNRFRNPVLQACHASWSLGATIGPVIFKLFLVELPASEESVTFATLSSINQTLVSVTPITELVTRSADDNTTQVDSSNDVIDVSDVRFAFVTAGALFLIPAAMYLAAFIGSCHSRGRSNSSQQQPVSVSSSESEQQQQQQHGDGGEKGLANDVSYEKQAVVDQEKHVDSLSAEDEQCPTTSTEGDEKVAASDTETHDEQTRKRRKLLYVLFLFLLFLFYHINMYVEQVMMSYLTSFAIKYLGWTVQKASNVLSLYYLFHFGSRVAAIPLIAFLQPRTMMACNIMITAVACLMLLLVNIWQSILWISSALIGYGVASTFSTGILWISATIRVTGRVSSTFIIGSSSGSMVAPLVVGLLFENVTPMAFVYMLIAAIFCHATLFVIINVYIGRYSGEFGIRAETAAGVELSVAESADTVETDHTTYF